MGFWDVVKSVGKNVAHHISETNEHANRYLSEFDDKSDEFLRHVIKNGGREDGFLSSNGTAECQGRMLAASQILRNRGSI